ncbi:MAG: FtsW/RodA/SpoVE family cell cycle protein, partial [Gammaproteobacteria bacterium]|nr:FtsW/RodA/SpoVE family cell cycle protein [Gammaproteobacteria bacterium]
MNIILAWLFDLWRRFTRTVDWMLLAALCALMAIGLAVLHSASGQNMAMVTAQAARYGVGLAAMWLLSRVTPLRLRAVTPGFYALSILPLVLVLFLGTGRHGQHWLNLGVFYFQPAELM